MDSTTILSLALAAVAMSAIFISSGKMKQRSSASDPDLKELTSSLCAVVKQQKELLADWSREMFAMKSPDVAKAEMGVRMAEIDLQRQRIAFFERRGEALRKAQGYEKGSEALQSEAEALRAPMPEDGDIG